MKQLTVLRPPSDEGELIDEEAPPDKAEPEDFAFAPGSRQVLRCYPVTDQIASGGIQP